MKAKRSTLCSKFEERLSDYVAGRLSSNDRIRFQLHLDCCRRCSQLEATVSGVGISHDNTLVDEVLRLTSGPACTELDELLSGYARETLEPGERDLVKGHLDNCPGCSAIALTLGEIGELLPELAAADPGNGFAYRVLGATSMHGSRGSFRERVLEQLRMAFLRPRFSWEAAYLGCLILFGLFALAGRFAGPSTVLGRLDQSGMTAAVEERFEPLIQAGTARVEDVENVFRSLARSASKTCDSFQSVAQAQGRQAAEAASLRLTLIRQQLVTSSGVTADWIGSLWTQLWNDKSQS